MRKLTTLWLLAIVNCAPAAAQRNATEARGTIGGAAFLDESSQAHFLVGGSLRQYITGRFSIEPEVLYLRKDETDQDLSVQISAAWDFRGPGARVQPYAIGGAGFLRTYRTFRGPSPSLPPVKFTETHELFTAGFGAKIWLNDRWYVAPEARLGWEMLGRLTVSIGYRF